MSYTEMYMLAFVPNAGNLPSIGSVTNHFHDDQETKRLVDLVSSTREAKSIMATFGVETHQCYVDKQVELLRARMAKQQRIRKRFWERSGNELGRGTSTNIKASKWVKKLLQNLKKTCA